MILCLFRRLLILTISETQRADFYLLQLSQPSLVGQRVTTPAQRLRDAEPERHCDAKLVRVLLEVQVEARVRRLDDNLRSYT